MVTSESVLSVTDSLTISGVGIEDLRRDPFYIEACLLGSDTHAHPGLIDRVSSRVTQMASGILPSGNQWPFVSGSSRGSIIGTGSQSHDQEDDAGAIESVFELCVSLIEWQGTGPSTQQARDRLRRYLVRNQFSDVDYAHDKLQGVKQEVRHQLRGDHVPTDHLLELIDLLSVYLGACSHVFEKIDSEDDSFEVYRCDCGAALQKRGEAWLAV